MEVFWFLEPAIGMLFWAVVSVSAGVAAVKVFTATYRRRQQVSIYSTIRSFACAMLWLCLAAGPWGLYGVAGWFWYQRP